MTRIAVVGAGGMLGTDLMTVLAAHEPVGFTKGDLDITDSASVTEALVGFDVIVNAAAYTQVDDAESNAELAFAVNATGPLNIARACEKFDQRLIHVSTDYVFDGLGSTPYPEDHPTNPASVYGASKAEGERNVRAALPDSSIIVRTAWLYGHGGPNFVATMLTLATSRDTVSVVTDQVGQPTWSRDLAGMISSLIDSRVRSGILHGTNAGQASWYDFAQTIFDAAGLEPERVLPTTSESFVRPAPRPTWSVLGHDEWERHGLPVPRHWREAFQDAWNSVLRDSYKMPHPGGTP